MPNIFRDLLRSSVIFGGAQVAQVMLSLVRTKVVALLLGPEGIGLLGVYTNLQGTAVTAAGLGIASSGVRSVARAKDNPGELAHVRLALLLGHLVQGVLAALVLVVLQRQLAVWLVGDPGLAIDVALVGLAVVLAMVATSQTTLLRGLRQTRSLALTTVISSALATIAGVAAVGVWQEGGLAWLVVVQSAASVGVAFLFVGMLARTYHRLDFVAILRSWRELAANGAPFMLAALASTVTLLIVRTLVARDLGLHDAGQLAASWSITVQYVGLLLAAMSTDYYPRLVELNGDRDSAVRLMNDQLLLVLAISGPALVLLIGVAPWVMTLLYTHGFDSAARLLQWQCLGNILKLVGWPLSFALMAGSYSRLYLAVELLWNGLFLALVWVGLPLMGVEATGLAFTLAYLGYAVALATIVHVLKLFSWRPLSVQLFALQFGLGLAVLVLAQASLEVAMICGAVSAVCSGLISLRIVLANVWPETGIGRRLLVGSPRSGGRWSVTYDSTNPSKGNHDRVGIQPARLHTGGDRGRLRADLRRPGDSAFGRCIDRWDLRSND